VWNVKQQFDLTTTLHDYGKYPQDSLSLKTLQI